MKLVKKCEYGVNKKTKECLKHPRSNAGRLKTGYWLLHGRLQNEMTFLSCSKKQAVKKGDKINKGKIHKGKIIKM